MCRRDTHYDVFEDDGVVDFVDEFLVFTSVLSALVLVGDHGVIMLPGAIDGAVEHCSSYKPDVGFPYLVSRHFPTHVGRGTLKRMNADGVTVWQ